MATLTTFDNGGTYSDADIEAILNSVKLYSESSTLIRFKSSIGDFTSDIKGTGFAFDANGYPTRGTVTALEDRLDGKPLFTLTGVSMSIGTFIDLSDAPDDSLERALFAGADLIKGSAANDFFIAYASNDSVYGYGGDDWLDGGSGNDAMFGGLGDDVYVVDSVGDIVTEALDSGIDGIVSSVTISLGSNVEHLQLSGTAKINGAGNGLANELTGNSNANLLSGAGRNDRLFGYAGADTLNGGSGNDLLDGGTGNDHLTGGMGNDTYVIDARGDQVIEAVDGGTDTVQSSFSYQVGANIENLVLLGTTAINGTGDARDNRITGSDGGNRLTGDAGDDQLFGMLGRDTLTGGTGNDILDGGKDTLGDIMRGGVGDDTYYVYGGAGVDRVEELAGEGVDHVIAVDAFVMPDNIENLTLIGDSLSAGYGNDLPNLIIAESRQGRLEGGGGDDTLIGSEGSDIFIGDGDRDLLVGGDGDDLYLFNGPTQNVVVEARNGGYDRIWAATDFVLPDNVEGLHLTGDKDIDGTGNRIGNSLAADGAGDNKLYGLEGDDHLNGGLGDDTLDGGAGNDILLAGSGIDTLYGGRGDDIYYVNNQQGTEIEARDSGIDTVFTARNYVLGANFENLTLGYDITTAQFGTGNELGNVIVGNQFANTIRGLAGSDKLDGGRGADVLEGGIGNDALVGGEGRDRFTFNFADGPVGRDTVLDFTDGQDLIVIASGPATFSAFQAGGGHLFQDGDDVVVAFDATGAEYVRLVDTPLAHIGTSDFVFA